MAMKRKTPKTKAIKTATRKVAKKKVARKPAAKGMVNTTYVYDKDDDGKWVHVDTKKKPLPRAKKESPVVVVVEAPKPKAKKAKKRAATPKKPAAAPKKSAAAPKKPKKRSGAVVRMSEREINAILHPKQAGAKASGSGRRVAVMQTWVCTGLRRTGCGGGKKGGHVLGDLQDHRALRMR
jgi:hypothetical protein